VSVGTVSNVLNKPEIVTEATRDRVLRAIRELGFVTNEPARQLKTGASRTIGYLVIDVGNPFFTDVASGIEEVAEASGLGVYICSSGQDPAREAKYLEMLGAQRVKGVLVTPLAADGAGLRSLSARGIPLVLVDHDGGGEECCSVSVDDVLGAQLAVTHLLEGGHRRIAFVGGPATITQVADRLAGARLAVDQAHDPAATVHTVATTAHTIEEGRRSAARILGMPAMSRVTAAFCGNDLVALGLLQELLQRGVRVPQEIAIVGYDDIYFCEAAVVPVTSVRQPRHQLGRTAAELLLEEARGDPGHVHRNVRFEPELVVRASSDPRRK
jgi:LacI family transcriptional regulator, galactose operon repressor